MDQHNIVTKCFILSLTTMADYPAPMFSKCEVSYQLCHSSCSAHENMLTSVVMSRHTLGVTHSFAMGTVGLVTFTVLLIQIKDSATLND